MPTRTTKLFNIAHPIIRGCTTSDSPNWRRRYPMPVGWASSPGCPPKTPQDLVREIERCRQMTDKPFGVNLTFLPTLPTASTPDYPGYIEAIIAGGVKIV